MFMELLRCWMLVMRERRALVTRLLSNLLPSSLPMLGPTSMKVHCKLPGGLCFRVTLDTVSKAFYILVCRSQKKENKIFAKMLTDIQCTDQADSIWLQAAYGKHLTETVALTLQKNADLLAKAKSLYTKIATFTNSNLKLARHVRITTTVWNKTPDGFHRQNGPFSGGDGETESNRSGGAYLSARLAPSSWRCCEALWSRSGSGANRTVIGGVGVDSSRSSWVSSDFSNDSRTYSSEASLLYAHITPANTRII